MIDVIYIYHDGSVLDRIRHKQSSDEIARFCDIRQVKGFVRYIERDKVWRAYKLVRSVGRGRVFTNARVLFSADSKDAAVMRLLLA